MKLEQNIPDWNKTRVWNKIENRLRNKKKRRFIFWWFLGTASLILLVGFLIKFNQFKLDNTTIQTTEILPFEQKSNSKKNQYDELVEPTPKVQKSVAQVLESTTQELKSVTETEKHSSLEKEKHFQSKNTSKEFTVEKAHLAENEHKTIASTLENLPIEDMNASSIIPKQMSSLASISKLTQFDLASVQVHELDLSQLNNDVIPLKNIKEERSSFLGWVEGGIHVGRKSIRNGNIENNRDLTREQFRFVQSNTLGFQTFLNHNLFIKSGITYQTIYEKYQHADSFVEVETVFSEEAIVYELQDGVRYVEEGMTTQKVEKTRSIIHNNFIHRLSIPVELGYVLNRGSWSLEQTFGIRFQFFQQFDGIISQNGQHFFDLREINESYYANNLGMGLITSLNLKYGISPSVDIGLKLSCENDDIFNIIKTDYVSKYDLMGLQLGYYKSF